MASINLTQLAYNAALEMGLISSGMALSTDQNNDALFNINGFIDNWSSESAMVLALVVADFTLTANTQSYTIGSGETFATVRPVDIPAAAYILTVGGKTFQSPIAVVNAKQWAAIEDRSAVSPIVTKMFYDHGFPIGNVSVSDVPSINAQIELTMWQPLPSFVDLTTPITIPPGYSDLYMLAAAIAMSPQFKREASPLVLERYRDEVARIRNLNAKLLGEAPPAGQDSALASPGAEKVQGQ